MKLGISEVSGNQVSTQVRYQYINYFEVFMLP